MVHETNEFILKSAQVEKQNIAYGAGTFQLSFRTVRFSVAKKTARKMGIKLHFLCAGLDLHKKEPCSHKALELFFERFDYIFKFETVSII